MSRHSGKGSDPAARSRTVARCLIDILNLSDYAVMIRIRGCDGGLDMEVGDAIALIELRATEEQTLESVERDLSHAAGRFTNNVTKILNAGHGCDTAHLYERLTNGSEASLIYLMEADAHPRGMRGIPLPGMMNTPDSYGLVVNLAGMS